YLVYEGKHIVKPVYFKRQPTILYASAGFGNPQNYPPSGSSTRFRVFTGPEEREHRQAKTVHPIPPSFVRGARLHALSSLFTDRILTKPKRWAISTVYNPTEHIPVDRESSTSYPTTTTSTEPTARTTRATETTNAMQSTTNENYISYGEESRWMSNKPNLSEVNQTIRRLRNRGGEEAYTVQLSTEGPTYPDYPESTVPDYLIRQNYLPAKEDDNDQLTQFEMEGYRPVVEPEVHEPMRPVQHSPAPWAYRDVHRFGPPRHPTCSQPLNRGVGPDEVSSWYFDNQLNVCRWFGYRGYGGNANRFYSRISCESLCIRDVENLCDTVKCSWPGTHCSLVGDQTCKRTEEMYGRDWQMRCPPDQPVCLSRRGTRIAPDIDFKDIPRECFQRKDPGPCERKNPAVMFYYDRERNDCMTFYYHNCGGNDNRFETKSDCMSHCSP
ncbi:putative kunitz-type protease inhibitor, partial [Fasciolopsis buskii]